MAGFLRIDAACGTFETRPSASPSPPQRSRIPLRCMRKHPNHRVRRSSHIKSWSACPEIGRYEDSAGHLTSCVSPDRDNRESTIARYFESCDDAYAWSGDDANGTDPSPVRACAGEDWEITFCP